MTTEHKLVPPNYGWNASATYVHLDSACKQTMTMLHGGEMADCQWTAGTAQHPQIYT